MSFEGFTEADITRLNKPHPDNLNLHKGKQVSLKKIANKNAQNTILKARNTISEVNDLPEEAKLSFPPPKTDRNEPEADKTKILDVPVVESPEIVPVNLKIRSNENEDTLVKNLLATPESLPSTTPVVNSETAGIQKKFKDLDEFQARQKLFEEQNRKRKELLAQALAARTKQTQEEAQRLNEIKVEFKKLDALLSSDVKILRSQIEAVSLEYMEAQVLGRGIIGWRRSFWMRRYFCNRNWSGRRC